MKKYVYILSILIFTAISAAGQNWYDEPLRFFSETDFRSGLYSEKLNPNTLTANYTNPLNPYSGNMSFTGQKSFAFSSQLGYYFNKDRNIGIGVGLMITSQSGQLSLDSFHVEYQSVDYKDNVFRQVVSTDGPINESVKTINLSVPIFLRYKKALGEDFSLTVDAGIIISLLEQNKYSANANFDYEAIYKFEGSGSTLTYLYDGSPVPGGTDWLITQAHFLNDNPKGDVNQYFNFLNSLGYSVALGDSIHQSGHIKYVNKSVGFYFQSAINYRLRPRMYGKGGIYVYSENFSNLNQSGTPLTSGIGNYNSLTNYLNTVTVINYGLLFGIDFYF